MRIVFLFLVYYLALFHDPIEAGCHVYSSILVATNCATQPREKIESNPYQITLLNFKNDDLSGKVWAGSHLKINSVPTIDYSIGLDFRPGISDVALKVDWLGINISSLVSGRISSDTVRSSVDIGLPLSSNLQFFGGVKYFAVMENEKANGFLTLIGFSQKTNLGPVALLAKLKGERDTSYNAKRWFGTTEIDSHYVIGRSTTLTGPGVTHNWSNHFSVTSWRIMGVKIKW